MGRVPRNTSLAISTAQLVVIFEVGKVFFAAFILPKGNTEPGETVW